MGKHGEARVSLRGRTSAASRALSGSPKIVRDFVTDERQKTMKRGVCPRPPLGQQDPAQLAFRIVYHATVIIEHHRLAANRITGRPG